MVKCSKCGNMTEDGARFCPECGADMSAQTSAPMPAGTVIFPAPPLQEPKESDNGAVVFPGPDSEPAMSADTPASGQPIANEKAQPANQPQYAAQPVYQPQFDAQPTYQPQQAYQQNIPVQNEQPVRTLSKEERKRLRPSGGKRFLAFMLRLLAGMLVGILIILLFARVSISKSGIKSFVNKAMEGREDIYEELADAIDDELRHKGAGRFEDIEDLDGLYDLIAEAGSDAMYFILTGDGELVDKDAVVEWVEDNKRKLERATGKEISKEDMREIKDAIDEINDDFFDEIDDLDSDARLALDITHIIFGNTTLFCIIGAIILLYGLNYLIFGRYYDQCTVKIGVMTTVHAAIGVAGALTVIAIAKLAVSLLGAPDDISIEYILGFFGKQYLLVAGLFLAGGILFIVLGKLLRKSNKAYRNPSVLE